MNETQERGISWKESLLAHLQRFGYWLTPAPALRGTLQNNSKKTLFWAGLNLIGVSMLVSLAIQGMLDKPEVLSEFILEGNWKAYSVTILGWGIFTYLQLLLIVAGIGGVLPFLCLILVDRYIPKDGERRNVTDLFVTACYAIPSILFYVPLVYVMGMLSVWSRPQMVWLLDRSWENGLYYATAGIVILAILGMVVAERKIFAYPWRKAIVAPVLLLVTTVGVVIPFINF